MTEQLVRDAESRGQRVKVVGRTVAMSELARGSGRRAIPPLCRDPRFVSSPILAAAIGYVTKLVAVRMMFRPLEYVGCRPFGWRGVVPRRAARMAGIAVDMMTTQLISPADVVRRLDPVRIARQIAEPPRSVAGELTEEWCRWSRGFCSASR